MRENYTQLQAEIQAFHTQTLRFLNKELNVKEYKSLSGGFGCYAQRGGQTFMLRLRINQGILTSDTLKFIIDICEKHNITRTHITTCQTIQLHDLSGLEVSQIMEEALHHDIICRGGGGDFPRNIMCSPLSGVDPEEYFDVLPYAKAVGNYILDRIQTYQFPRKFKIAFSSSDKNETHANFRDLGFCANADGTFDVYCAGGLGNQPLLGIKVAHHIQPSECLYYVKAMMQVFQKYGNYTNRAKARTRYLQATLGQDGLQKAFDTALTAVYATEDLHIPLQEITCLKEISQDHTHPQIFAQKQAGYFAVYYHPLCGTVSLATWLRIYQVIKAMPKVQIRLTPQQGMYIVHCTMQEALQLCEVMNNGACTTFETSIACIGATTCQSGLRDSQGTLRNIIMYMREKNYANHVLPRIYISGCISSCGTNQIAQIGFQGTVKVIDKTPYPAYQVSLHGEHRLHHTKFGEILGCILEDDICTFLNQIAMQVVAHQMTYEQWVTTFPDELHTIVEHYIKK